MPNVIHVDFRAKRCPIVRPTPAVNWLDEPTDTDDALWATLHLHVSAINRMLDEQAAAFGEIRP